MHPRIQHLLDEDGAEYRIRQHNQLQVPIRSPRDFAQALGYEEARITKTLFLRASGGGQFCLAVLPSNSRARLDAVATLLHAGRVQLASSEELKAQLDYPSTGVSPLGGASIPVFLDAGLMHHQTILIGSGAVGVEIEISPLTLQRLADASVGALAQ